MKSANRHILVALVLLVVINGVGEAAKASPAPSCPNICAVALEAKAEKKTWRSPQRFGKVTVNIAVYEGLGGDSVPRRLVDGGCTALYRQPGLFVRVEVCGKGPVPIRLTYRGRPGTIFTFAYEGSR